MTRSYSESDAVLHRPRSHALPCHSQPQCVLV